MKLSEGSESSSDIRNPDMYRRIQGILGEQSYSLVLPKIFATNLGIRKGDYVKVRQLGDKIIVEKA
jgi:phosphate uptake regulator